MCRIKSGEYTGNDLAWTEGCAGAVPLSQIIAQPASSRTPPPRIVGAEADLILIVRKQKSVIWLAVLWVVIGFTPRPIAFLTIMSVAWWILHVLGIVLSCQLARALRKNVWLWALLTLAPFANLFAFARIVSDAGKELKAHGIPSGILGADRAALDRLALQETLQPRV